MDIERMKTRHSAETIRKLVEANKCFRLPSGSVVLPPARMAFADLAAPGKNMNDPTKPGKFGVLLLFPLPADQILKPLIEARNELLREAFPKNPTGAGMKPSIKEQDEKVSPEEGGKNPKGTTLAGFVPGLPFIGPRSNYRPQLFVPPIVNGLPTPFIGGEEDIRKEFYSGAWVIGAVNLWKSSQTTNPGVFLGIESVLKVMDDDPFRGTGGVDPRSAFGSVQIGADVDPASLF